MYRLLLIALFITTVRSSADAASQTITGVVVDWSEGMRVGSFDLEVGAGDRLAFQIDLARTRLNGIPAFRFQADQPTPFGTYEHQRRLCARVTFSMYGRARVAETVTTLHPPRNAYKQC